MLGGLDLHSIIALCKRAFALWLPVINARDYCLCTGTGDDLAGLNAALAAAENKILFVPGTPQINGTWVINKKCRIVFEGGRGVSTGDKPSSYIKKAATMTTVGMQVTASDVIIEGGGVVSTTGATGGGIAIEANGVTLRGFSAIGVASDGVGIRVGKDVAGANCNSWGLDSCNSCGWGSHGFYVSDSSSVVTSNANAGNAIGCVALSNGGDGFKNLNASHNNYIGGLGETNTGYGFNMAAGFNNWINGGDYEVNTAGQVIYQAASQLNGDTLSRSTVTVTDNGFYTRTLGNYNSKVQAYTPCLIGTTGVDKTITAVTIAGSVCTATVAAHGYSNGDMVWIRGNSAGRLNLDGAYVISNVAANTFDYTYRTDSEFATPTTGVVSTTVRKCGVYTNAKGEYQTLDGRIQFNADATTSALTGITGNIQILLPRLTAALNGSVVFGHATLQYYSGVTHAGKLSLVIVQDGSINPPLYDTIGSGLAPAPLAVGGLAAATRINISGWYWY